MMGKALLEGADATFTTARVGLIGALKFYEEARETGKPISIGDLPGNLSKTRLALNGIAYACDALKAAANAYNNILGSVTRQKDDQ